MLKTGLTSLVATAIFLAAIRAYDEIATDPVAAHNIFWHPDGDEFCTTPQFKAAIREVGTFKYWKSRGFPPHCKPIGDDDFECGRPIVE